MDTEALRIAHYNATVEKFQLVHPALLILRVRPDFPMPEFAAGQYTTLGLGDWERRVDGVATLHEQTGSPPQLIRRAYSIACTLLDEGGRLVRCSGCRYFEFYVALVSRPNDSPPPLTPRLFALREGDRLYVGEHPHGRYTLSGIRPDDNVIFAATGTGEAPHNAMSAELLAAGHRGRIASLVSVRYRHDAGYAAIQRRLEEQHPNYRYVLLTTREPENLDSQAPGYVGKQYLQDLFAGGHIADAIGWAPQPDNTHVYVCGNPAMIGLPTRDRQGRLVFPEPSGLVEVLSHRGFQLDEPRHPGNIHVERYW